MRSGADRDRFAAPELRASDSRVRVTGRNAGARSPTRRPTGAVDAAPAPGAPGDAAATTGGRGPLLAGLLLVPALLLAAGPAPLSAQQGTAGAAAVRTTVTLDPATGERTEEVLRPLTADERLRVEGALEAAGLRPGAVDGRFDERTREALTRLQRRDGLPVCGCVDAATLERLRVPTRTVMTTLAGADAASGREVEVVYPSRPSPEVAPAARGAGHGAGDGVGPDGDPRPAIAAGPARDRSRTPGRTVRTGVRSGSFTGFPVLVPVFEPPGPLPPRLGEPAAPREAPAVGRLPARPKPPRRVPPPR